MSVDRACRIATISLPMTACESHANCSPRCASTSHVPNHSLAGQDKTLRTALKKVEEGRQVPYVQNCFDHGAICWSDHFPLGSQPLFDSLRRTRHTSNTTGSKHSVISFCSSQSFLEGEARWKVFGTRTATPCTPPTQPNVKSPRPVA